MINITLLAIFLISHCGFVSKKSIDPAVTLEAENEVYDITQEIKFYVDDKNPYLVKELSVVVDDLKIINDEDVKTDKYLKDVHLLEFDYHELKYKDKYIESVDAI
jgi:hypothetical protein